MKNLKCLYKTGKIEQAILILLMTMCICDLFGQNKLQDDPFWEFDKTKHFRPKLNKGDYFKLTGFNFGWFVLEPISDYINETKGEYKNANTLSYGQKALYYWWYVDAQVTNGGFEQFYFNGYGIYAQTAIKALKHIGDIKMAELINRSYKLYLKEKKRIDDLRKDIFDGFSNLYRENKDFNELNDEYYKINNQTMNNIENYFRKNPNEICLDEDGNEFDMSYTGDLITYYPDKGIKDKIPLVKGVVAGTLFSYHQNGKIKDEIQFVNGEQTGERYEYYENGNKKYSVKIISDKGQFEHFWYHENGNPKKLEHKMIGLDERIGEYKEWYENGQLAESGFYISNYERIGKWLEFYKDGKKKLEAEFKNGDFLIHNFWLESGEQTLKNGTGIYIYDNYIGKTLFHTEHEYKNSRRHGKQYFYEDGVIYQYQEMEEGKYHGITRNYYNNGSLKEEIVYNYGNEISIKTFPMVDDPYVDTQIVCEMQNDWLSNRNLEKVDRHPEPTNTQQIATDFKAPLSLFEGYPNDYDIRYSYFVTVDETGNVIKKEFSFATNVIITQEVEEAIQNIKFIPATKNNNKVLSYIFVNFIFRLNDK